MRAVRIEEFGGPEVLRVADVPVPEPGAGELLIRVGRAGVNFGDTHQRRNQYIAKHDLPLVLGGEVAGVVERVGPGTEAVGLEPGDRAIALLRTGGYAEYAVAPAARAFPIPDGVADDDALALLIQGLTAWHLLRTCAHVADGESVVVHSAAGGVGSLVCQLARPMGAGRTIATAGSAERRERALELGADAAVDPEADDLAAALVEANAGEPVDVVLDAAGGRVFEQSLAALAPLGRIVAYGNSTREQVSVTNGELLKASRTVVGFWLMHLLDRRDMLEEPLRDLLERAGRGELRPGVGAVYPLSEASRAHGDLEGRRTTGKLTLDPSR